MRKWAAAAALLAPVLAGRGDSGPVLAALRTADPRGFPEVLVGLLSHQHLVRLCAALAGQNAWAELDSILTWCAGRDDGAVLRAMLHEAGLHALGYRLAERQDELTGHHDELG